MHRDWRGGAMIDVQAGIQGLERELRRMTGRGKRRSRTATRPSDRVQIDVVRHLAGRMIRQRELDQVTFADTDEASWHVATKGPKQVIHTIGHAFDHFANLELHAHLGGVSPFNGRWNLRCLSGHGDFLTNNSGVCGLGGGNFGFNRFRVGGHDSMGEQPNAEGGKGCERD